MKKILNKLIRNEQGQALIFALIMLAVGSLIVVPLLAFMSTGLMAAQTVEEKMNELYAADAGVEDALHEILTGGFDSLAVGDDSTYPLTNPVNGETVSVTVTKLSLVESFIGDEQYHEDQPHEGWIQFSAPLVIERTEVYVEYSLIISFYYDGVPWRRIDTIAAVFGYSPASHDLISEPFDIEYLGAMTDTTLDASSPEVKHSASSFGYIWRWNPPNNDKPSFRYDNPGGSLSFRFRVNDGSWTATYFFIWALVGSADVSYITNAPGLFNWIIESTASDTTVRSYVLAGLLDGSSEVHILTWEVNP